MVVNKSEMLKESVKRLVSTFVMVFIFVIGLLAVQVSSLIVGQQEEFKTTGGEEVYVNRTDESSATGGTIVVENDKNLRVREITPVKTVESINGQ